MVWGHAMVKVGRSESRLVVSVKGKRATGGGQSCAIMHPFQNVI